MDRHERYNDLEKVIRTALHARDAKLWTALPAIIQSFDPGKLVIRAQPALKFNWRNADGTITSEAMPVIGDIPILTPRGGGATLSFPVKAGDECLLIFADRCIDHWWQNGGVQRQAEHRMHDLSDGFAIVGPFSQPQKIASWNTDAVELRSNDGQAVIALDPVTHDIDINTLGDVTITAQNLSLTVANNLTITVTGNIFLHGRNVFISSDVTEGGNVIINGNIVFPFP